MVSGLQTIITNLGNDVTAMDATPPFADGVTQPIVDSLTAVSSNLSYISYFSPLNAIVCGSSSSPSVHNHRKKGYFR